MKTELAIFGPTVIIKVGNIGKYVRSKAYGMEKIKWFNQQRTTNITSNLSQIKFFLKLCHEKVVSPTFFLF